MTAHSGEEALAMRVLHVEDNAGDVRFVAPDINAALSTMVTVRGFTGANPAVLGSMRG